MIKTRNISNYTLNTSLKFDRIDAIEYLYNNGGLPLNTSRKDFALTASKTTICSHIRLLYAISWQDSKEVFLLILHCITDSKAIVTHLRNMKNNENFDHGWWKQEAINDLNPYCGGKDSFFDIKVPFKSKDINDKDIDAIRLFLYETNPLPKIYLAYRTLYEIFLSWDHHIYKDDLCITTLECAHLRFRLDKRVIERERESFKQMPTNL